MTDGARDSGQLYVWTAPPETAVPITESPFRVAVGTPSGRSSNSWRVWVRGSDAYVACRDNFREFRVSLHASGIWRVALTEQALQSRPELALAGGDRLIHRHQPDLSDPERAVLAFQVVVLQAGLYLERARRNWPESIVFIEPPEPADQMTVLSVLVAPRTTPIVLPRGTRGAIIAVLPLAVGRSVQVVASHEGDAVVKPLLKDAHRRADALKTQPAPSDAVFVVYGNRPEGTPWFSAVRDSDLSNGLV